VGDHRFIAKALCCLLCCVFGLAATSASAADDELGIKILNGPAKQRGYRKTWAVIVGINYQEAQQSDNIPKAARNLLPELKNAEKDATSLQEVLRDLYDYEPECTKLLIGAQATKAEIERALHELNDDKVKPEDSVMFFFSGHATRVENEIDERGALLAADVRFSERGKLLDGHLRMHKDLLSALDKCVAKHKLLILDCCHSGEIFSLRSRARSEVDDRRGQHLFEAVDSLQAIASCRDRQRATDGIGENSPFTSALLQGLRRIPAREGSDHSRLSVNQLYVHMLPELKNLPNGQSPDCRQLGKEDGEFSFFPSTSAKALKEFEKFVTTKEEIRLLQAMVPGDHGNWWFEEMPWFIPSLRLMILEKATPDRAALQSSAIRQDELRKLAHDLHTTLQAQLAELSQEDNPESRIKCALLRLRLSHFKRLLTMTPKDAVQVVQTITDDFDALETETKKELSASDLHLYAVAKHYLHQKKNLTEGVKEAYKAALDSFKKEIGNELALKALCHTDYGKYLSQVLRDHPEAANQYHLALTLFGSDLVPQAQAKDMMGQPILPPASQTAKSVVAGEDQANGNHHIVAGSAPPAFRVFALCSEAEAWQRQNRWGKANDLLNTARYLAQDFDSEHELMVFVLNRVAWANMEQWRIEEAQQYFRQANEILVRMSRTTSDLATVKETTDLLQQQDLDRANCKLIMGHDYNSLTRFLHHLHGLAMAKRFLGHEQEAIQDYRRIIQLIAESMTHLKETDNQTQATLEMEQRLLERLINAQERLADCNLFGNAAQRDLREAADDYRRALQATATLPAGNTRSQRRMGLLYRLAITLSLPSTIQDVPLALEYCREAETLRRDQKIESFEVSGTLGLIAEAIVNVYAEKKAGVVLLPHNNVAPETMEKPAGALANLRKTISSLRDELNGSIHRDQLEALLLATKVLTDEDSDTDRYHLAEDAELMMYFCRIILPKSAESADLRYTKQDSSAYLRSYFDTVMRTKLRMKPQHVKDLLEVQAEATTGKFYTKPEQTAPILAIYLFQDQCLLLLDIPGGVSRYFTIEGQDCVADVLRACSKSEYRLPLPSELQRELVQLRNRGIKLNQASAPQVEQTRATARLQLRWLDPLRGIEPPTQRVTVNKPVIDGETVESKTVEFDFPFLIPDGIETDATSE
jgi:tetratricopeptide (TPR) repeat protein